MNPSNVLYTSIKHFREETKIQAKFFKKLSLNQYRTAVAERYGFKSIKLFEDSMDMIVVTVLAYENLGSSGGFDWFELKEDALAHYHADKVEGIPYNTQHAIFECKVSSYETAEKEIEEMDYAGLADNAETMFPYPPEIWKEIIASHNKEETSEHILSSEKLKVINKIYEQAQSVESALNIFKGEGGEVDSFNNDEYGEYLERLANLKKMTTNANINPKIIKNVIKDFKLYPENIKKEEKNT